MRVARLVLALVSVLGLAACSSGAAAQWTYAPAPPATPKPSLAASAEASGGAPSASAEASGSPEASGGGGSGDTVTVVATSATKFDTPDVSTAADKPFTLVFDNQDSSAPHNVVLTKPDGSPVDMGDNPFFQGPEKREYKIAALSAASYPFHCQVHPNMTGTLTVE